MISIKLILQNSFLKNVLNINLTKKNLLSYNADKQGTIKEKLWENPEKFALPNHETTYTGFKESKVDWSYVERVMPLKIIPELPKNCTDTQSGWRPPQDPQPTLTYFIKRLSNHLPPLFLERRRDELNPKTMDFEYIELVTLKNIHGDIFACEKDLRNYLESNLKHSIATQVDELKGFIKVKGADRTLLEKFIFDAGF